MPTPYLTATEEMVLKEFKKMIDLEDPVLSLERPEPPDGLMHTKSGHIIWVEVTTFYRDHELAKFLNKYRAVS